MIMNTHPTGSSGDDRIRFELIERLGKGGAGSVWRARLWGRHGITRNVALKVVEAGDQAVLCRVRDEARLLGLLQHRALVQVQDLVELEGGRWGMVMELLEGVDLQGLTAMGPVPFGVLLDIVSEVADALDCALKTRDMSGRPLGLTHRDVKPANLLMCADGRVKLLDFGVARANISTRESVTLQGELWGTLGYMSPERLHGEDTPAVDVYALGVVMYELALRQRFGRASLAVQEHDGRLADARRRLVLARAPEGFIALTLAMLDFYPASRPDAAQVRDRARALRVSNPEPVLSVWAGKVVPYARQARLSRLAPTEPPAELWTVTPPPIVPVEAPPSAPVPTLPTAPAPSSGTVPMVRPLAASLVGEDLGRILLVALVLLGGTLGALRLAWPVRAPQPPQGGVAVAEPAPVVQATVESAPLGQLDTATVGAPEAALGAVEDAPPAPAPAPVRPPTRSRAAPVSRSLVQVSAAPEEAPPPTVVVIRAPASAEAMGVVRVSGEVVEAVARSAAGEWRLPGVVPEGTYTLMARFDDGPLELAGVLRVRADQTLRVRCDPATRACAPERP